jgi:hypothetical protein
MVKKLHKRIKILLKWFKIIYNNNMKNQKTKLILVKIMKIIKNKMIMNLNKISFKI